jgi:hypothetical protein
VHSGHLVKQHDPLFCSLLAQATYQHLTAHCASRSVVHQVGDAACSTYRITHRERSVMHQSILLGAMQLLFVCCTVAGGPPTPAGGWKNETSRNVLGLALLIVQHCRCSLCTLLQHYLVATRSAA